MTQKCSANRHSGDNMRRYCGIKPPGGVLYGKNAAICEIWDFMQQKCCISIVGLRKIDAKDIEEDAKQVMTSYLQWHLKSWLCNSVDSLFLEPDVEFTVSVIERERSSKWIQ